jgi:hypothetical protein
VHQRSYAEGGHEFTPDRDFTPDEEDDECE